MTHGQDLPPLRPAEVQALLRCSRTTVHYLAQRGRLTIDARTPGGHRRYRPDSPALVEALAARAGVSR